MSIEEELAEALARHYTPHDTEVPIREFTIPKDHFCWGCPWGKAMPDRFICPFVEGSCARIPKTIIKPDIPLVNAFMHRYECDKTYDAHAVAEEIIE